MNGTIRALRGLNVRDGDSTIGTTVIGGLVKDQVYPVTDVEEIVHANGDEWLHFHNATFPDGAYCARIVGGVTYSTFTRDDDEPADPPTKPPPGEAELLAGWIDILQLLDEMGRELSAKCQQILASLNIEDD